MRERKLVKILERMPLEEREEFTEYLRSPLHSRRPKLAKMVERLEDLVYISPSADLSSEDFYEDIYPGKAYDANDLNRSCSVILKELKGYLALLQYRKDKAAQMVCLLYTSPSPRDS